MNFPYYIVSELRMDDGSTVFGLNRSLPASKVLPLVVILSISTAGICWAVPILKYRMFYSSVLLYKTDNEQEICSLCSKLNKLHAYKQNRKKTAKEMTEYKSLKKKEFQEIASKTQYTFNYVRKILRGYVDVTPRNRIVIEKANEILEKRRSENGHEK